MAARRKCFISYFKGDEDAVAKFIEDFGHLFIPRVVGTDYGSDLINSNNSEYIMSRLRREYLADSTVTICLIGSCTHGRRYVDWELKASLRSGDVYKPNGVLAILLPGLTTADHMPPRVLDNWDHSDIEGSYAVCKKYPKNDNQLAAWIEDAYQRRSTHINKIVNTQGRLLYNRNCNACGVTH